MVEPNHANESAGPRLSSQYHFDSVDLRDSPSELQIDAQYGIAARAVSTSRATILHGPVGGAPTQTGPVGGAPTQTGHCTKFWRCNGCHSDNFNTHTSVLQHQSMQRDGRCMSKIRESGVGFRCMEVHIEDGRVRERILVGSLGESGCCYTINAIFIIFLPEV